MANHTKGEWVYDYDEYAKQSEVYSSKFSDTELNEPICIIPHDDITDAGEFEMLANSRLIECAPKMYDLLQEFLDRIFDGEEKKRIIDMISYIDWGE